MLIFGAGLMIVYCLATRPKAMTEVLKDTGRFLTIGSPIREQEYKEYPFAMFLALGYAPAWILANCVMPM
jgi:hypothetical protein